MEVGQDWYTFFQHATHAIQITMTFLSTGIGGVALAWMKLRSQVKKVNAETEAESSHGATFTEDKRRIDRLEADVAEMRTGIKHIVSKLARLTALSSTTVLVGNPDEESIYATRKPMVSPCDQSLAGRELRIGTAGDQQHPDLAPVQR
jgi:hypothetical protein